MTRRDHVTHKKELEMKFGEHMVDAIRRYIDHRIKPGGFLTGVITNDLKQACGSADHLNQHLIHDYVIYFYNYCPATCWGSVENFNEWMRQDKIENESAGSISETGISPTATKSALTDLL